MTMIPPLPTRAQELWMRVPRKYRLSATLAGSAYHVSRAGVRRSAAPAPAAPPAPRPGPAGGTMQRRRKVPDQSRPAATLAADTRPSMVDGAVCAETIPTEAANIEAARIPAASDFI